MNCSGVKPPIMTDEALALSLEQLPGERVTRESILMRITSIEYLHPEVYAPSTVTICSITLDNGYSVRGESACVDPANYNQQIGEKLAYEDAFRKLWPLFGFLLAEDRHRRKWAQQGPLTPTGIARVCHEVNRAYCQAMGDYSQPAWDDAPQWQKDSAIAGVRMHLEHPEAGPEQSHESWMAQKLADGWVHGEVKDAEKKTHPCLVPFNELPTLQQAKDYIFRAIVHAVNGR